MRTALMITGVVVWGATAVTLTAGAVWMAAERTRAALQARREARTHLSDASLDRFLEQAARDHGGRL